MICGGCGAENSEDALFCARCGEDLSVEKGGGGGGARGESPLDADALTAGEVVDAHPDSRNVLPRPPSAGSRPAITCAPPYHGPYATPRADGLCVAGMVLGVMGLTLFWIPFLSVPCGILGIVLGSIGIKNVQGEPENRTGQVLGVVGVVTGTLAVLAGTAMFILYVVAFVNW